MENILTGLKEKEKEAMERQILMIAVDLLAERGFLDNVEKSSVKRRIEYEEVSG
ncbi:hypothetical protein [Parablautia muri]|uniref:hypothetical protein n=1 Tax=Parablautia muri TaxID=2320879 RepID=UPI0013704718|nr:hypothetical protein [Parablautia muri]